MRSADDVCHIAHMPQLWFIVTNSQEMAKIIISCKTHIKPIA